MSVLLGEIHHTTSHLGEDTLVVVLVVGVVYIIVVHI
jgi:hypothetical protein